MSSSKSSLRVWHGEKEREVFELYSEDLDRLTINSKPVINNLTEVADEYKREFAPLIVRIIEDRVKRVAPDQKLPQLYLLDSIIKNHTAPYASLFQQNLVSVFAGVFQACPNEKIRAQLFKLRSTWGPFFTYAKLNQLDRRVKEIDPAWPVQDSRNRQGQQQAPPAQKQPQAPASSNIHLNPKLVVNPDFIKQNKLPPAVAAAAAAPTPPAAAAVSEASDEERRLNQELERLKQMRKKMEIQKQIEAEKRKIEEIEKSKKVEEGKNKVNSTVDSVSAPASVPTAKQSSTVKVCRSTKVPPSSVFYQCQSPPVVTA